MIFYRLVLLYQKYFVSCASPGTGTCRRSAWLCIALMMLILTGCSDTEKPSPMSEKGGLDLRNWHFEKDGAFNISGEYEFYVNKTQADKRIGAQPHYVKIPAYWYHYELDGEPVSAQGYATFRLKIYFAENRERALALKFLTMGTAYRAFVNGAELASAGTPGTNVESSIPGYAPEIVTFPVDSNVVELVYFVSNYHHARGGVWSPVMIGTEAQLRQISQQRIYFDIFVLSALLVMGLYFFGFYLLNRYSPAPLVFAIFCMIIAFRILTTGEIFLLSLVPDIQWKWLIRLEYLSFYLATPVFTVFIYDLFKTEMPKRLMQAIVGIGAAFSLIVLFSNVRFFTATLIPYQLFTIIACLFVLYFLWCAVDANRNGAKTILGGFILLFMTILNDILFFNGTINTMQLVPLGLFGFTIIQAFLIAYRYAYQYQTIETQKAALSAAHEKYRNEMGERLAAEEQKLVLEEKLHQAERMEAMGLLAGGVAHNLNNILSGVVTYPEYLLSVLPGDSELREPLLNIQKSGKRAAEIVQDLVTLSRKSPPQVEVVNLNDIISNYLPAPDMESLIEMYKYLQVNIKLQNNLLNIYGAELQLQQLLLHLVSNGAEAVMGNGDITIRTENRHIDVPITGYENVVEGDYVVLSISDNGKELSKEDLKRIFEPFYTRKKLGRNVTGLGLAVVWGIMEDHKGYINLTSGAENGTTIELFFPATREGYYHTDKSMIIEDYTGHGELVLIVDDILEQREIAANIIRRLGYSVITLGSGEEAVELVRQTEPAVLLLDMIMDPGIDGYETYRRILKIRPDSRALITSGYGQTEQVDMTMQLGAGAYLQKPYTIDKLGIALKKALRKKD